MRKSWDAPAKDELTTCVTEHHSAPALAALRAGGSSAARAVDRKHVHANRQGGDGVISSVACVLFEDLTAGEVVCIIPLVFLRSAFAAPLPLQ